MNFIEIFADGGGRAFLSRMRCPHFYLFIRNVHEDEMINGKQSLWQCEKCNKQILKNYRHYD